MMRQTLARLFDKWETQILRPIIVTLLTTTVLVLGSLLFKPIRLFLFPPEEIRDYPLYCTAEAYVLEKGSEPTLGVDFFIVNLTGDEQTRDGLSRFLREANPDPTRPLSPDIHLRYSRDIGEVARAYLDQQFNADKGELHIRTSSDGVGIVPIFIEPRVVMKVSIVVVGLPTVAGITRATPLAVPFAQNDYQRACYSR